MFYYIATAVFVSLPISIWLYGIRIYQRILYFKFPSSKKNVVFNTQKRNTVALTIDDVPRDKEALDQTTSRRSAILDICNLLKRNRCSATLMMIGSDVENASQESINRLREYYQENVIEFANHGYHDHKHASLSESQLTQDLQKTENAINSRLRTPADATLPNSIRSCQFYRPGHGMISRNILRVAELRDYLIVLGDVYSFDPQIPVALFHLIHIMITIRSGSIIIIHDRPWTPTLLRWLLPLMKWRGYGVQMLSQAMQ
eukprot:gb/GECH01001429.1/.p1 GENE.gb/GECH01001429.1/~~gb/GECH01001429.1/.p1  ORF type:complete len:259 (+),score=35.78 gb/GECH01001429.1/:1-777(+)